MVKAAREIIQAAVIEQIKKSNNLTYQEIADSIGVHMSHIQKASKGTRLLSESKVEQLCERWNINLRDITDRLELDDAEYLRKKTLMMLIKTKTVAELAKKTGISPIELYKFKRGKGTPTEEEINKMAEVLDVDSRIIQEGLIAIVFEIIEKSLKVIYIDPEAIEAVKDFLVGEL